MYVQGPGAIDARCAEHHERTLLMVAAGGGGASLEVVAMLLQRRASLLPQFGSGFNALMCAAAAGEGAAMRALLSAKAALDVQRTNGMTALMVRHSLLPSFAP